jgi:hypothetical protein
VSPAPSSPATSATRDPRQVAAAQAVAAYRNLWAAFAQASRTSDPNNPDIARFSTGEALSSLQVALTRERRKGIVGRGAPVLSPRAGQVRLTPLPSRVEITDCSDSTQWRRYNAKTGKPIEGSPGGRRRVTAIVSGVDGSWKVTRFAVQAVGTC